MNNYLTEESLNKLKEELEYRKVVTRAKINKELKEARAQGDLSENFEYKAAKSDRAQNEGKIHYLQKMIKTAKIIKDTTAKDEVGLGKQVTIEFLDTNEIEKFTIVTTVDVDPLNNKISIESPLGKSIYKHKVGEKISISSPNGSYYICIKKIC